MGNMKSQTDPDGNKTQWFYDALGRVTREEDPAGASTYYHYDANGNVVEKTDRDGRAITYVYDQLGRETAERWYATATDAAADTNRLRTISYTYDLDGDLLSASDPDSTYTYSYGNAGEVDSITAQIAGLAPSVTLAQTYDWLGERVGLAATIGSTPDLFHGYGHDAQGRWSYVTQDNQWTRSGRDTVAGELVTFQYDSAGQLQYVNRYADNSYSELVASADYNRDGDGRIASLTYSQGSNQLQEYQYLYNGASRITSMWSLSDGQTNYTYDAAGQLTGAEQSYTYDSNGNRLTAGNSTYGTPGPGNRMTSDGTYTYSYDAEGNRTARFIDADSSGTLNSGRHRRDPVHVGLPRPADFGYQLRHVCRHCGAVAHADGQLHV